MLGDSLIPELMVPPGGQILHSSSGAGNFKITSRWLLAVPFGGYYLTSLSPGWEEPQ